jgi:hypothetical protein
VGLAVTVTKVPGNSLEKMDWKEESKAAAVSEAEMVKCT